MKKLFNLSTLVVIAYSLFLFSCAGTKTAKVDPYVGDWEYTAETDQGSLDVTMSVSKIEDGYAISLSTDMGSVDLYDLEIADGKMTGKFDIQGYEIPMKGTFEGDKFTGSSSWEGQEMPINATKVAATE